jgi:hypothetical protein
MIPTESKVCNSKAKRKRFATLQWAIPAQRAKEPNTHTHKKVSYNVDIVSVV